MVSAFAAANGLVIGQGRTNQKSNEITAIPELKNVLDIEDCIITIDAMGCQTKISETIIANIADYILAIKENQKELNANIIDTFRFAEDKKLGKY
jgi:predicted transposase YbfD/YdcC